MNINENKLRLQNLSLFNPGVKSMSSVSSSSVNPYISDVIDNLKKCQKAKEACKILEDAANNGDFSVKSGVLFKHEDYTIQNMLKIYGESYKRALETVGKLGLSITPIHIETIEKENEMFIVSHLPGTKSGELIPYSEAKNKVSKEDKLAAFKDLQKLTQEGLVDNEVLNGKYWFVTPDTHKIMLPEWSSLRRLQPGENKAVLEQYYNILFNK